MTAETDEPIVDNATPRTRKHIDEYVATNGEVGHEWRPGVPTLLLTTRGRKSGQLRRTPLIYGRDGDDYLIVASLGGAEHHPAWYLNLVDEPEVHLQVLDDKFNATARTASEAEKPALWAKMVEIWPAYVDYQAKTERVIPIVVLTRA